MNRVRVCISSRLARPSRSLAANRPHLLTASLHLLTGLTSSPVIQTSWISHPLLYIQWGHGIFLSIDTKKQGAYIGRKSKRVKWKAPFYSHSSIAFPHTNFNFINWELWTPSCFTGSRRFLLSSAPSRCRALIFILKFHPLTLLNSKNELLTSWLGSARFGSISDSSSEMHNFTRENLFCDFFWREGRGARNYKIEIYL